MVLAPYGILQSLLRERDLDGDARRRSRASCSPAASSASISCRTCRTGANTGTRSRCAADAAGGAHLTLVESVRQDRRRHLTIFEQRYRGAARAVARREHRFDADVPDPPGRGR